MTISKILEEFPDAKDLEIKIYVGGDGGLKKPSIYIDDEMLDVPNSDCVPSGKKLLIIAID